MADGGGTVSMSRGQGQWPRLRSSLFKDSDKCKYSVVVKDVGNHLAALEPFTDEAEQAKEEQERLQFLREKAQYAKQREREREFEDRILDYDPKQDGKYYNRLHSVDLTKFDLDEESPLGPMRFTDAVYKDKDDYKLCEAINIFSVKIGCSDVGFPIHVYGTVIARDSIDQKCLYLFRRDEDDCQVINSEDESLVLKGPKRGLALISNNYIETDLKIKDDLGQVREFSKGILTIRGIARRSLKRCEVESCSLATRLSTVDVTYGFLIKAVEGTIGIEVKQGDFDGRITACTTSIPNELVLYDSVEPYGAMTGDGKGVIQLVRPVVCVPLNDMLVIVARTRDGKSECTIRFTPMVNSSENAEIRVGAIKMRVNVTWSIMNF
ncbi:hypothetical protein PR202_ga10960 [Eleusine coracana subsp. coracana]|uniref:DUF6598 domain-containing protein n=1 Tax=Eleusine coracana subsp. coracana TaxID=191504 RepID=A0AAV5C8C4_ELECO|nr:hypothetical protein PR202_ga10960 [Eleusine coracana subsp. coracana]